MLILFTMYWVSCECLVRGKHSIHSEHTAVFKLVCQKINYEVGHVQYISILTWLWGFRLIIANFLNFLLALDSKWDFQTKKITPNIWVCPESLTDVLEYLYIKGGLLCWNLVVTVFYWMRLSKISLYVSGEQINDLSQTLASQNNLSVTQKNRIILR